MIPLMKNTFLHEHETKQALADFILKSTKLSMGQQCFDFEKKLAAYQGRKDAVLFNSGGSANLATLQTLLNLGRLKRGDRVGFSALTWSTNVMPIIQMGLEPVPIDCSAETLNVMSETFEAALRTTPLQAFFTTNALGFTGDLDVIQKICDDRGIILLEDNCESLGTELPAGKAGNFSLASTFSFFVAHHMSTIEGGMVCTDDEEFSEMLRIVRANGWDRNLNADQQIKWRKKFGVERAFDDKYTFYDLGYNLRPTEITGFLGQYQLQFLEENITKREANYRLLEKVAGENSDLKKISSTHLKRVSNFSFPVICTSPELREKYLAQFSGAGVEVRPMIAGNIEHQPFFRKYVSTRYELPGTDLIHFNGFYFGNYPELTEADLETLVNCLKGF
jgi:CDP-6-deoxy-D-xylo-4-hexulose-3-dehydrase